MSNTLTAQESSRHVSVEDTTMGATAPVAPRHPHRLRVPHQPDAYHDHDHVTVCAVVALGTVRYHALRQSTRVIQLTHRSVRGCVWSPRLPC